MVNAAIVVLAEVIEFQFFTVFRKKVERNQIYISSENVLTIIQTGKKNLSSVLEIIFWKSTML